jgi:hypothetical protein
MMKHDPELLQRSSRVRFTEDTVEMKLGEGLWKTITGLRPYRQDFIDVREGMAGTHTVVEENGMPVLLALRLRVFGLALAEVETMVVRNRQEGILFQPDAFKTPNLWHGVRAEEVRAEHARGDDPHRHDVPRGSARGQLHESRRADVERRVSFRERAEDGRPWLHLSSPGCENMKAQAVPKLPGLTYRVAAVDEEMGVVWLWQDFGPGSVPGGKGDTMISTFEAFKVYGGKIHAAEAILESAPVGRPSGWNSRFAP